MVTFHFNGHRFDVNWSSWSGKEEVLYDGRTVSEKRVLTRFKSTHTFSVSEAGASTQYEVTINTGDIPPDVEVRRNGILIYCRNRGGLTGLPEASTMSQTRQGVIRETVIKEITLVVCPHCSHRNDSSRRTCENCGASI
ncbi:MAG: hypothetical protein ACFFD9_02930 [Candidatus Thorarchaeota archaeon]